MAQNKNKIFTLGLKYFDSKLGVVPHPIQKVNSNPSIIPILTANCLTWKSENFKVM